MDPRQAGRTILLCFGLVVLSDGAASASEIPLLRLVERIICQHHHESRDSIGNHHYDQEQCKIPAVQDRLAWFMGAKMALDAMAPLLTSLWYGHLANRFGRRIVIALGCTGELLNLLFIVWVCFQPTVGNVNTALASAAFLLIGGGRFMLFAMFYIIIVDLLELSRRAQALYVIHGLHQFVVLVWTPLGAQLTRVSIGFAFFIIISVQILRYPFIWLMDETVGVTRDKDVQASVSARNSDIVTEHGTSLLHDTRPTRSRLDKEASISNILNIIVVPGISFCCLCYLIKRIAFSSERLIYQYASERLHITLQQAAWFQVPLGLSATIINCFVLPTIISHKITDNTSSKTIPPRILRISLLILVFGFLLCWLSMNSAFLILALTLCGAGGGLEPSLQGLASSLLNTADQAQLFAFLGLLVTVARLIEVRLWR